MKKLLLGIVGAIALAAPASAADLAARPYTKAPAMIAAVYDWSGFYIGANGGWGTSHKCWDSFNGVGGVFNGSEGCHDASGGVAGGQLGYRWQAGTWVFGVEGQGNWADLKGRNVNQLIPGVTNESKIGAFGLLTGQIGYAANNVLFYVKGGAAVTDDQFRTFVTTTNVLNTTTNSDTRWGGTVGAGIEFGFSPNWSAAVEYDHLFMGNRTYSFTNAAGTLFSSERIKQDVDMVTVRVNYRWGGPVVAKY
ncbi:MAG: porin family protein [Bradyrhizobium sp.]|nr:porin family protein [Bradyrhizobium sp.]